MNIMSQSVFSPYLVRKILSPVVVAGLLIFQTTSLFGKEQKVETAACDEIALNRALGQCKACHSVEKGETHLTGPNLHNVYGRQAGKVRGFNFTGDLKAAKFKWDDEKLDRFLADPRSLFPNTAMAFGGVEQETERVALVCYFRSQTKRY